MSTSLARALDIDGGIVCAVGAGGKKSTLYRLLADHSGRAAYTATVFTHTFPESLPAYPIVETPEHIVARVIEQARRHDKLAFACRSDKPARYAGLTPGQVIECHREGGFDLTLVKADGARMRGVKVPAEGEPNLVPGCVVVLGLVSVRVIGLKLNARHVHRPERFAALTGAEPEQIITPRHVADLIAADEGLFKDAGEARRVAVINMVDQPRHRDAAMEVAERALALGERIDRVVLTAMRSPEPVVAVVRHVAGE